MLLPFVSLRPEVTRTHAMMLMDWLTDERVTRYLNESRDVSRSIGEAIDRTRMPILTQLFNQEDGRFFMVHDRNDAPAGFVRLIKSGPDCEIVLAIGNNATWGRGLGSSAIREALKIAFLGMRAESVIAKVHPDNSRSLKAFDRFGFRSASATATAPSLFLTAGRYRELLREPALRGAAEICITDLDRSRLQDLLLFERGQPGTVEVEHELERANVVAPQCISEDVVTMNSRISMRLDDEKMEVTLVYPDDKDERSGKLSILSDIGAAILGCRDGDAIDCLVANRTRSIRLGGIKYQPEAAGDLDL
jgi:regulator of nucleoside diphosphate kinase